MPAKEKNKTAKIELQRRIRMVQEWLLQDHVTADIITESMKLWGVTERQAYRYLWAARKFFEEKNKESIERKRGFYLARKRKLLRDMDPKEKKTAAGVAAVDRVLNSMAKMEGVTTDTIKLIGDPAQPMRTVTENTYTSKIDYSKVPTDFLKMMISMMDAN